jgi:hypothetical protein
MGQQQAEGILGDVLVEANSLWTERLFDWSLEVLELLSLLALKAREITLAWRAMKTFFVSDRVSTTTLIIVGGGRRHMWRGTKFVFQGKLGSWMSSMLMLGRFCQEQ